MSFKEDLEAQQYVVLLAKKLRQRPEHIASTIKRKPHMHPYIFVHIAKFDAIPHDFSEIYLTILRKGKMVQEFANAPTKGVQNLGKRADGEYILTLHGRGESFGQHNADEVRYRAGCLISFSSVTGIKISEVKCTNRAFLKMLKTADRYKEVKRK